MNKSYKNALAEVDVILKAMPNELLSKIPKSFLKFVEEKKSSEYIVKIDVTKPLNEQELLKETRSIISLIYRSYLCAPEDKKKLKQKDDEELKEKYNYDNLFKKRKS